MKGKTRTKTELHNEIRKLYGQIALLEESNTRYKQLEEGLKEQHQAIFGSMTAKVFYIDHEGRILRATKSAADSLGMSAKDIVGKIVYDLLPANDALKFAADDKKIMKSGKPKLGTIEEYTSLLTGKKGWLECDRIPYYDKKGNVVGLIIHATDITERKKAQEALLTSQFQLKAAMDLAHIVYWEADLTNKTFLFNDPFYNFYGTTAEEQNGYMMSREEYARKFIHPEDIPLFYQMVKENEARNDREFYNDLEHRIIRTDGEVRTIIARTKWIRNDKGRVVRIYGANQDITEAKRAEEDKRRLELQLAQSQKMEALGTLAGGIAHDFNNILEGIIGFAEMIKEDADIDSAQYRRIGLVLKGAQRGRDLVKQILTFSRRSKQEQKPVALKDLVEEGLRLLRPTIPSTIEIRFRNLADDDTTIIANSGQMHQILMNLCTNAAHAMREKGGFLEIDISQEGFVTGDVVPASDMRPGTYLVLTVNDTGCGIEPGILERIFDPFFTTKGKGEGTGLGLSVVHGIVENHNGYMTVRSKPGNGSTFRIYLPKSEIRTGPANTTTISVRGGKEDLLFVDDEEIVVDLYRERLAKLGYSVFATTSSTEALNIFKKRPQQFDLVIADYTMPNLTGIDLAAELLRIRTDIPIILLTGHGDNISTESARLAGIRECLMKPQSRDEIALAIRRTLDTKPRKQKTSMKNIRKFRYQ